MNQSIHLLRALWLISALTFALVLWFATPRGLGLSPDSVAYLKAVQGLINGQGISYFSVQWPPLFSTAIYIASQLTDHDFVKGARLLSAVLYGCTFLLTGRLLNDLLCGKGKWLLSYLFAGLLCLHPVAMNVYFYVFSESLYLPIVLLNLVVLARCQNGQVSTKTSLYLCALGLLATSTRYAGLTIVALNIVVLWRCAEQESFTQRAVRSMIQLVPTIALLGWWRQHLGVGDTEANQRHLVWHPLSLDNLYEGLVNLGTWVLPLSHQARTGLLSIACVAVAAIMVVSLLAVTLRGLFKRPSPVRPGLSSCITDRLQWIICAFAIGYLMFLVCMRSLFDPNIVFDPRTLAPICIPVMSLFVSSYRHLTPRGLRYVALALLLALYMLPLLQIRPLLLISYFNGIELNDKRRLDSPLLRFLRQCPQTTKIYADQPWNLNLEFQSMVHWLPSHFLYGSGLIDLRYDLKIKQLPQLADLIVIENRQAELVQDFEQLKSFRRVYDASDGLVWQANGLYDGYCVRKSPL